MFFPNNFAPDTWLTFKVLDIELQEAIFDVMEELDLDPSPLNFSPLGFASFEVELFVPSGSFLVFITVERTSTGSFLRMTSLGVLPRPSP